MADSVDSVSLSLTPLAGLLFTLRVTLTTEGKQPTVGLKLTRGFRMAN